MKVANTLNELTEALDALRRTGASVGLVPTMGALHEGHMSLIRESVSCCDSTVVSLFVNPVQFSENEDFDRYPRHQDRDIACCRDAHVSLVFCPSTDEMYAPDRSVTITETSLASTLCGRSRPGHFDGVCTVVAKLFNLIQPDKAFFGQKDAQQLAVIRRMVRDLNFDVDVVGMPIVREPDGLAMSSRNAYLTVAERAQAIGLYRMLTLVESCVTDGEKTVLALEKKALHFLAERYPDLVVEYLSFVDTENLMPVDTVRAGCMLAVAAKVGGTRLIDNTVFS